MLGGMARSARNGVLPGDFGVSGLGGRFRLRIWPQALGLAGAGCGEQGPGLKAPYRKRGDHRLCRGDCRCLTFAGVAPGLCFSILLEKTLGGRGAWAPSLRDSV
jgi:hypothetical protein